MNPIERRIRSVPVGVVYKSVQEAFPGMTDTEIVAELMRTVVFVAVCWNDVIEGGQDSIDVLHRQIFTECDELSEYFPWPSE